MIEENPLIKDCIEIFINEKKVSGKSEKTISQYEHLLKRFELKFKNTRINDLDREELLSWLHSSSFLKIPGKKGGIVSRYNMSIVLKNFFKRFNRKHFMDGVEITYNSSSINIRPVGLKWLREKINDEKSSLEWKLILSLLVSSGLRANELLKIKIKNINFKENLIEIISKGKKESDDPDYVPFSPKTRKYLIEWINENDLKGEDLLITMKYWTFWYNMKKDYGITPHQLRHTFCTELDSSGYSPTQIKLLARHKNIRTTERYMNPDRKDILKKYKEEPLDI